MSSNFNVMFSYEEIDKAIKCGGGEKMSSIFERFAKEINSEVNDYNFYYKKEKIEVNSNKTVLELNNYNTSDKSIIIKVKPVLKIIKCPECDCNDCIMKINDYKLSLYGCKNDHNEDIIFSKYDKSQIVDFSNIMCDNPSCTNNQQICWGTFYKCLTCTSGSIDVSKYFCNDCKAKHNGTHILVKYNEKDFYCTEKDHYKSFVKYCEQCKKDICEKCLQKEHKGHNTVHYDSFTPKTEDIYKNLENIKKKLEDLRINVDNIKVQIERAFNMFEKYYSISKDVIEKYELYNKSLKNHRILYSLKNIEQSNKEIIKDLEKINSCNNLKEIFEQLINRYLDDRNIYTNNQINNTEEDEKESNINGKSPNKNKKKQNIKGNASYSKKFNNYKKP